MSKSLHEIVAELDNFPYYEKDPAVYARILKSYHALKVQGVDVTLGYIPNIVVQNITWPDDCWLIDSSRALLCYVEDEDSYIHLWITKHSKRKQTYPGMLDCTAAGALSTGHTPRSAVILEATEEASIKREIIETGLRYAGCISYFHAKDHLPAARSDSASTALLLSEIEYLYELELDQGVTPRPKDLEVEDS
ncbi:uncharacterized protein ACLA_077890 [Aspergillus clavatus NRRL 1]|uniref:Nudix hydrolase domain-containing protein n=1 Tax=Aspergillus clavatus (strain ATCC 1007 / CBS 513.65 / DSM 816 / NCTC 3887 / NRRL 1 / QM 1276 / 107) TaxID=344612 RepID=A1CLR3_ASPCL|nr:uncharacterized protein ACLA_077890 [Aspergillus clavatus NRRL 1]EAW09042.1 hypothetical protein ACLA_077890 [Aspergillus clavatus NRRL 1]